MIQRLRRRLLIFGPILAVLVFLLWPLSGRQWDLVADETESGTKERFLAGQSAVRRGAPRVILIVADDLGTTDISLYGGQWVQTPRIDSIGIDGVTFTDASCTTAVCAPSRASLLTGRYQQRFGFELQPHDRYARSRLEYAAFRYIIDTDPMVPIAPSPVPNRAAISAQGMPEGETLLSELLSARGYRTAIFGKWHLGYSEQFSPLRRGFDEHYGFYEAFSLYSPTDDPDIVHTPVDDFSDRHMWNQGRDGASAIVRNDEVIREDEYLTFRFAELAEDYIRTHADEPFFLYLPFSAPHTPLQAPVEYYDELDSIADPVRRTYYAMIAALDDAVGTVLDAVDDAGIADSTLVIFTSDNGGVTYLGVTDNGPYAGGKFSTFQGGLSVPLMMRYPGSIPAGTTYRSPVSLLDVYPTVEAAARERSGGREWSPPAGRQMDGVDLLPYVRGQDGGQPHDYLFWRSSYNSAVRRGPWKLIVQEAPSPDLRDTNLVRLFNLDDDPYERSDLSAEYPGIVTELRAAHVRWQSEMRDPLWPPVMHLWMDVWGYRYWFAI